MINFISMEIDDLRFVYQNEDFDIIIIEILEKDELYIDNFLEIDDLIYQDYEQFEEFEVLINKKEKNNNDKRITIMKEYNVSVYLLHFPKFESISYSTGLMTKLTEKYELDHTCESQRGSSGGPIINLLLIKY